MIKLHDYQARHAARMTALIRAGKSTADLSQCGTGKTLTGCEVVRQLGDPVTVVVGPLAAASAWERWSHELGVDVSFLNYDMARTGRTPVGRWEMRKRSPHSQQPRKTFIWNPEIKLLLVDEAHRCKAQDSLQSFMLRDAKLQGIPTVMMTATLAETPLDFSSIGLHFGLFVEPNFYPWALKNRCFKPPFGGLAFTKDERRGEEVMAKIRDQIAPQCVRITTAEIPDFPETQIEPLLIKLDNPDEVNELYAQMAQSLAKIDEMAKEDKDPHHPLTMMLRARMRLEALRVPVMEEMADDLIQQHQAVAVFCAFRESLDALWRRTLPRHTPVRIEGGQTPAARKYAEDSFQSDATHLALVNSDAGGISLSLHDLWGNWPRYALHSPLHSGQKMTQLFGRVCRSGGKSKSIQRVLFVAGSCEEDAYKTFQRKCANMDTLQTLTDRDMVPACLRPFV